MKKNIKILKAWWEIASPKKMYMVLQFLMLMLRESMYLLMPLAAAKVITYISSGDYNNGYIYLSIAFGLLVIGTIFSAFDYHLNIRNIMYSYKTMQDKLYKTLAKASDSNFQKLSKDKLVAMFHGESFLISDFNGYLNYRLAKLFNIIVTFIIIGFIDYRVLIIILIVSVINFFVIDKVDKKIAFALKKVYYTKDQLHQNFSEFIDNKNLISDYDMLENVENRYFKDIKKYEEAKHLQNFATSLYDNYFFVFYRGLIYLITMLLIFLVSKNQIDLTLYLVVTSYLLSSVVSLNDFMLIFRKFKFMEVSIERINTILSMKARDEIEVGSVNEDDLKGIISFRNVSYKNDDINSFFYGDIKNFNLRIKDRSVNVIYGEKGSGKRLIFNLLRRRISPLKGTIKLDGINLSEYTKNVYVSNVAYTISNPKFFGGSILSNFTVVEKNRKAVKDAFILFGLDEYVLSLKNGYKTNMKGEENVFSSVQLFMLGIVRAYLTKSEVIMIYELPAAINEEEKANLNKVLNKLKEDKTIILFTANKDHNIDYDSITEITN